LIHLNGPTAVGKSPVARLCADRHPGVLDPDIDRVVAMIGGWRERFSATVGPARNLALGMAETHLRVGFDVVMPQLVAKSREIARFAAVASASEAEYREIVLMTDRDVLFDRFASRAGYFIDTIVEEGGGRERLAAIHGEMVGFVLGRPRVVVVATGGQDVEETYAAVLAVLAE
jgi:predicted kinase